jgi:hypothetical protein
MQYSWPGPVPPGKRQGTIRLIRCARCGGPLYHTKTKGQPRQEDHERGCEGVLYADGRRARTTSHRPAIVDDADGEHLVALQVGSGGTERQWDGVFWVHPLPRDLPAAGPGHRQSV